jgi:cytochrome c556
MMAGRARDQGNWIKDSKMLIDAGAAAYKAAAARDMTEILALNDQLNAACVTCHEQYRPNYHKKP